MAIKLPKKFPGMTYTIPVSPGNGTGVFSTNTAPWKQETFTFSCKYGFCASKTSKIILWMTLKYFTMMQRFLPPNAYLSDSHMMSKNSHF